jgi:hypothetical protein
VAFRHGCFGIARQRAVPGDIGRQALFQQFGVVRAADAIGERRVQRGAGPVVLQTEGNGAKAVGHRRTVDHGEDRQAELARQVGGRGRAVVQPHDTFNEDQVGITRRFGQAPGDVVRAAHPQVDVLARRAAGDGVDLRVEKIRTALEDAHLAAEPGMQPGQRGDHGGLALAGSGGCNEKSGAG